MIVVSGDQLDLDAIEAQARHWDHLIRDDPDTTLALVAEVRRLRAIEARVIADSEERTATERDWQRLRGYVE